MNKDQIMELRLRLLENGYTPLPNLDKRICYKGWPKVKVTKERIQQWKRMRKYQATGIRLENGLAVVDLDIDQKIAMEKVKVAVNKLFVDWEIDPENVPVRHGKGYKQAWFVRTDEPFAYLHSHHWLAPNAGPNEAPAHAEIFGGARPRLAGGTPFCCPVPSGICAIAGNEVRSGDVQETARRSRLSERH